MNDSVTRLVVPADEKVERWRPARAGIINLWRYWDETFTFHEGRLLLRGANGSGKSMALELLLPFLLDADSSPHRLTSAIKSRGSLYERVMAGAPDPSRTGFAWVEFSRGAEETFTVGARIRASESTRKTDLDFFTTSLRIGSDLELLDEQRTPLSRKALVEALGENGRVHASGEDHRTAVREVLFQGFDADRYSSVITALLALRKEKLSQNLDVDKLSAVLSEALPAIDEHDLATVAEGFERLDRRRSELAALATELGEVKALAARQRDYARSVIVAVTGDVRAAETRRDAVTRVERQAQSALRAAETQETELRTESDRLERRLDATTAEIDALKTSDAYRDGASLIDLRAEASRLGEFVERAQRSLSARESELAARDTAMEQATNVRDEAIANADLATADVRRAGSAAAADPVLDEAIGLAPDDGERLLHTWVRNRRTLIREVRAALDDHRQAISQRTSAEDRLAADQAVVEQRTTTHRDAVRAQAKATEEYAVAVTGWAQSCAAIGPTRAVAALPLSPFGPAEVVTAVSLLAADISAEHAVRRRDLAADRESVEDERNGLVIEQVSLAGGGIVEPVPPTWRSDRDRRLGAPLWRVVDVSSRIDRAQLDRLEAALLAAGLLDAWVSPDGTVDMTDGDADLLLTRRPVSGPTLADLLVPLPDASVEPATVSGVLASIALVPTAAAPVGVPEVAIGLDGTFRLGAAVGRGQVRTAGLLGAQAQERRRLAKLAELADAVSACDRQLAEIAAAVVSVDASLAATAADIAALPDADRVAQAERAVASATDRVAEAREREAAGRQAVLDAEESVRATLRSLTALAAQHQLPTTTDALDLAQESIEAFERCITAWARRRRELLQAARALTEASEETQAAQHAVAAAQRDLDDIDRESRQVEARLTALESAIGSTFDELVDRIGRLETERRTGGDRRRELSEARPALSEQIGQLKTELSAAEVARADAEADRDATHRRFVAAVTDGVVADADAIEPIDRLDGVTSILSAARSIAAEVDGAAGDDAAIQRASQRVDEGLHHARQSLGGRVDLDRELSIGGGWWLLRTATAGVRRTSRELAAALHHELEEGRAELLAEEEALFEQTLAGSVRQALADRIRLANHLVDGINRQLAAVRTAAGGVQVRLRWEVDPEQPAAVRAARSLLLRDPADLGEDERASLQDFVRARVDQARTELEANAPWEARLRETLDYRAWHRFTLQLAHRDWSGFEPATPRRLQRLSTGERSIALHLPMLASIAAHYADSDGRPAQCPRLILLDELFAGVDTTNRAQLFGTFTDWDLDAVFTSDHEWCQYATLDGIAIHHLHPAGDDEPVTSTRFTWDGHRRTADPTAA